MGCRYRCQEVAVMNLLEEQYRRSEKVRLKNKHEDRLLQHEIESHRGMRDVHRYRLEIVQREQREISRELDRIRMGIKRNLALSPNLSDLTQPKLDGGPRKVNQFQNRSKVTPSPRRHQGPKLKSLSLNLSRRQMSFDDIVESVKDATDGQVKVHSEEKENEMKNDDDDDDDSDKDSIPESFSSFGGEESESIPDPDILKAIMNGMVCDWEQNVIQTLSSTRNSKLEKRMSLGVKTPRYRRYHDSSPYSNATDSITPRRSLPENSGRGSNLKPPSNPSTSGRKQLSNSTIGHQDRRKKSSFLVGRRNSESASVNSQSQTSGKRKMSPLCDTSDRNEASRWPTKQPNQFTAHTFDTTSTTVAGRENLRSSRAVNQVASTLYRPMQTNSQRGPRSPRKETREIAGEDRNSKPSKYKLPTVEGKVNNRKTQALPAVISTNKMPTESVSYSARDDNPKYSCTESIDTVFSSRSDGYRAMKNGVQFRDRATTSSNYDGSEDSSSSVECQSAKFDFTTSRKRNLKVEKEPSWSTSDEHGGKGLAGGSETRKVKKKRDDRNDHQDKESRIFDRSIYKNPKLHIFSKDTSYR